MTRAPRTAPPASDDQTATGPESTPSWHALASDTVLDRLGSSASGLAADEATRREARIGPNRLSRTKPTSALEILVGQFASVVVLLLVAAAAVAFALGDVVEAVAVAAVLAINTLIGFTVELRARRAMDALLQYEVPTAKVVRDGRTRSMSAAALVPGDVIELEEGDTVPADARLLTASGLRSDEAPLTGESLPVDKGVDPVLDETALLAERASMVYAGTSIVVGRASAVVVETGARTEIGRIGTLVAGVAAGKTPLERRLDALGRRLVWLTLAVAAVVTGLGVLRGFPWTRMIETGVALAIAAVPEGLPVVATIALAVGLRRMARRNALVRRLAAVEALGATTVVCTDKTGTLTAGRMTAVSIAGSGIVVDVARRDGSPDVEFVGPAGRVDPVEERWLLRLLEAAALTGRAHVEPSGEVAGDPTDAALIVLARTGGVDVDALRSALPLVDEIPFSSHRRSSTSIHDVDGAHTAFVKGSPGTLLDRCARWAHGEDELPLDHRARRAVEEQNDALAARGLRVIGLARGAAPGDGDLTFLGLVGIVDPPAEGVTETIARFRTAGVRTVVITGDQSATARAIAEEVGAAEPGARTLDGREVARLSDQALEQAMGDVAVLSRVSPEDKLRVVAALQARGEIVAMLGDGVNDAAALKKADIGIAMGERGTDVARETASIVLQDDRFRTIGVAVEEGRVIHDNIRKFVFYLFSCNLAEVLVLLGASVAALPVPLLPLQILWLNMVTDTFPALALAMEPGEPDVMSRPPRDPQATILSRRFVRAVGFYAGLITVVTLAAFVWALRTGDETRAMTVALMTLALAQLFHLGTARSHGPVLTPRRIVANPWAIGAIPLVLALQLAAVYWTPLTRVLGTTPLGLDEWLVVGTLSALPAVVGQALGAWSKAMRGRR